MLFLVVVKVRLNLTNAAGEAPSPISKVVTMIEDMKATVEKGGPRGYDGV